VARLSPGKGRRPGMIWAGVGAERKPAAMIKNQDKAGILQRARGMTPL